MRLPSGDQVGLESDLVASASVSRRNSRPDAAQMSPARLKTMVPFTSARWSGGGSTMSGRTVGSGSATTG